MAPENHAPGSDKGTALVTGASAGIGAEFARQLAALGMDLVLVARRRERLEEIGRELAEQHGIISTVIRCDLADPDAAKLIVAELHRQNIHVDYLVNNAGCNTKPKPMLSAYPPKGACYRARNF